MNHLLLKNKNKKLFSAHEQKGGKVDAPPRAGFPPPPLFVCTFRCLNLRSSSTLLQWRRMISKANCASGKRRPPFYSDCKRATNVFLKIVVSDWSQGFWSTPFGRSSVLPCKIPILTLKQGLCTVHLSFAISRLSNSVYVHGCLRCVFW